MKIPFRERFRVYKVGQYLVISPHTPVGCLSMVLSLLGVEVPFTDYDLRNFFLILQCYGIPFSPHLQSFGVGLIPGATTAYHAVLVVPTNLNLLGC